MSKPFAALVLTSLLLVGCGSTAHLPTATYTEPAKSSSAILYVYRGHSMPTKANVDIQIDGTGVGFVAPGSFTWVPVQPGKRLIGVGYPSFPSMRPELEMEFAPGQRYLVEYDSKVGREVTWFGTREAPMPGVKWDDQGGYTRIRFLPIRGLSHVVDRYRYVSNQP